MVCNELMEGEINAVKTQLVLIKQHKGLIGKSILSLSKFNKMYFYMKEQVNECTEEQINQAQDPFLWQNLSYHL